MNDDDYDDDGCTDLVGVAGHCPARDGSTLIQTHQTLNDVRHWMQQEPLAAPTPDSGKHAACSDKVR